MNDNNNNNNNNNNINNNNNNNITKTTKLLIFFAAPEDNEGLDLFSNKLANQCMQKAPFRVVQTDVTHSEYGTFPAKLN